MLNSQWRGRSSAQVLIIALACAFGSGAPADSDDLGVYDSLIPSGPRFDSILGISTHLNKSAEHSDDRVVELEALQKAGVGIARTDFSWRLIEPEDDEFEPEGYDVMVDLATEHGAEVLAILDYGVDWAMPGGSHNEIPPEDFADFAGYVARHFGGRIRYYEVWNEPDVVRFWKPWPNPEHYGKLLKAASQAVRENDPDAVVLFGGMSNAEQHVLGPPGLWRFLAQTHSKHPDICEYFDVLAIHTYTFLQQSSPEAGSSGEAILWYDAAGAIGRARDMLGEIGCPDKPVWITEFGWPHTLIGEDRQASYLARGFLLSMAEGVDRVLWYTFWDGPKHARYTEDAFGLFAWPKEDRRPKPSYNALLAAHEILGGARFAGDLGEALGWDGGARALVFADKDGRWVVAVWKETASPRSAVKVDVPLPGGAESWRLIDQYGDLIAEGSGGPVEIAAGMEVGYLTFTMK